MTAEIAVVIPTYNRAPILDRCLAHLAAQTVSPDGFEVVVVDDASADDTPAVLSRWASSGRLRLRWRTVEKAYAGGARNVGVSLTDARRVLFLGDDVLAAPGLVAAHLAGEGGYGASAALVGQVAYPAAERNRFMRFLEDEGVHHDFPRLSAAGSAPVDGRYFYACNASVPRATFLATGGFDPRLQRACEDGDLGRRLTERAPLHFLASARGEHVHPIDVAAYVRFLRNGRDDIRLAYSLGPGSTMAPHGVLDRLASDRAVAFAARAVSAVDGGLPDRVARPIYRRLIRAEYRKALG